jgi:hypothetical protein
MSKNKTIKTLKDLQVLVDKFRSATNNAKFSFSPKSGKEVAFSIELNGTPRYGVDFDPSKRGYVFTSNPSKITTIQDELTSLKSMNMLADAWMTWLDSEGVDIDFFAIGPEAMENCKKIVGKHFPNHETIMLGLPPFYCIKNPVSVRYHLRMKEDDPIPSLSTLAVIKREYLGVSYVELVYNPYFVVNTVLCDVLVGRYPDMLTGVAFMVTHELSHVLRNHLTDVNIFMGGLRLDTRNHITDLGINNSISNKLGVEKVDDLITSGYYVDVQVIDVEQVRLRLKQMVRIHVKDETSPNYKPLDKTINDLKENDTIRVNMGRSMVDTAGVLTILNDLCKSGMIRELSNQLNDEIKQAIENARKRATEKGPPKFDPGDLVVHVVNGYVGIVVEQRTDTKYKDYYDVLIEGRVTDYEVLSRITSDPNYAQDRIKNLDRKKNLVVVANPYYLIKVKPEDLDPTRFFKVGDFVKVKATGVLAKVVSIDKDKLTLKKLTTEEIGEIVNMSSSANLVAAENKKAAKKVDELLKKKGLNPITGAINPAW